MATMPVGGWVVMIGSILVLWGVASWALLRTLRDEDRKLELLDDQGEIETYSPTSLRELRAWIKAHPDDPMIEEARAAYTDCVEALERVDEPFYDWSEADIDWLEPL